VKLKAKTHSINDDIVRPLPYININMVFFERVEGSTEYTNDSLMYHDILEYGIKHCDGHGFRLTELANWLMRNNLEMKNYYVDNKSRTPISARAAYRRQRIQSCLQNLIRLGLLMEKGKVKAQKNNELTSLYDFTREGYLLSAIFHDGNRVFNILESYSNFNDSFILTFIIGFFKREFERGVAYVMDIAGIDSTYALLSLKIF
jgi:hypothetical protein